MNNPQLDYSMFIDDYIHDAQVCFKEIRSSLTDLEKDPTNDEKFVLIYSGFHSIKGSSIMLGFKNIENFARACEERTNQIQAAPVTHDGLDELSKLTDELEAMVLAKVKNPGKPDAVVVAVTDEKPPDKLALFTIEDRQYAISLDAIERVIRAVEVTPLPKTPEHILGVINMQDRIILVMDIRRLFNLPIVEILPRHKMIILHTLNRDAALVVDNVSGVIESPQITTPDRVFPEIKYLKGMIKEGTITLILDIEKIVAWGGELDT